MTRLIYGALMVMIPILSWSQSPLNTDEEVQQLLDRLEVVPDSDQEFETLLQELYDQKIIKLDINTASANELARLNLLSNSEIDSIINHREKTGDFQHIFELQSILPLYKARALQHVLYVSSPGVRHIFRPSSKPLSNSYLLFRQKNSLQKARGHHADTTPQNNYLGSPGKKFITYRYKRPGLISFGITIDQDPGERIQFNAQNKQYFFDHISANLSLEPQKAWAEKVIAGNFKIQSGQGLVHGAGFFLGKSSEPILLVKRNNSGVIPYNSINESEYLTGFGHQAKVGRFKLTSFYSKVQIDGTISCESNPLEHCISKQITSLKRDGLHRTPNEIAKRNIARITTKGTVISYSPDNGKNYLGLTASQQQLSTPLNQIKRYDNRYHFRGTTNFNMSIHHSLHIFNINWFGETAISNGFALANLQGALISLHRNIDISLIYRNYGAAYHSFYSNSFSESSNTRNEKGLFVGLKVSPRYKTVISAYVDRFTFPTPTFRSILPGSGTDVLLRLDHSIRNDTKLSAQIRNEIKQRHTRPDEEQEYTFRQESKTYYFLSLHHEIKRKLQLRTRITGNQIRFGQKTLGITISQDINYQTKRLNLSVRYALFDTDSFENRIYLFERSPNQSVSFPFYHGQGSRSYIMAKYRFSKRITCWFQYSTFYYLNQTSVGSGLNETEGPRKSDVTLQLKFKL